MNREQTLTQLKELNLQGMYEGYASIIHLPMEKQPEAHYMIADLVEKEKYSRQHKKMEMYLKLSKIRYGAQIQDIECSKERNLSKELLSHLSDCNFIKLQSDRCDNSSLLRLRSLLHSMSCICAPYLILLSFRYISIFLC